MVALGAVELEGLIQSEIALQDDFGDILVLSFDSLGVLELGVVEGEQVLSALRVEDIEKGNAFGKLHLGLSVEGHSRNINRGVIQRIPLPPLFRNNFH